MPIIDMTIRTISCDGPDCKNSETFNVQETEAKVKDTPWMKHLRLVQVVVGGKNLAFCSDVCEAKSIGAGAHNPPEAKKIIEMPTGNEYAIKLAAEAARKAKADTEALKAGQPVTLG